MGIFLTAEWRHIVMLNYEIDPKILQPLVPAATELDTYQNKTYVSIVGFLFLKTKVLRIPIPFHRNFEEVNLRFYVRRKTREELRRGVVFIKELVPRFAIAATARSLYNEKYLSVPMRHSIDLTQGLFEYRWKLNNQWQVLSAETAGEPNHSKSGCEEEFIAEHYWGYSQQKDGSTMEYRVEHPRWRVWNATRSHLQCDVGRQYSPEFSEALSRPVTSAFVAEGSPIAVHSGVNIGKG